MIIVLYLRISIHTFAVVQIVVDTLKSVHMFVECFCLSISVLLTDVIQARRH